MPMAPKSQAAFRVCLFCGMNTEGPLAANAPLYWEGHAACLRRWLELDYDCAGWAVDQLAVGFHAAVVAQFSDGVAPTPLCVLCGLGFDLPASAAVNLRWGSHQACMAAYVVETGTTVADDGVRCWMLLRALATRALGC